MDRVQPYWMPPWRGLPAGSLGVTVGLDAVIARSHIAVVRIPYVQVHPHGMTVALERLVDPHVDGVPDMARGARLQPGQEDGFVLALRYADGREGATDLARERPSAEWPPHDEVVFGGGTGTSLPNRSYWRYWVWPLPPAGPVEVRCRWPEAGIGEAVYELDGGPLREAAHRASELWSQEDLPRLPGHT
jgi:hypothetical protein